MMQPICGVCLDQSQSAEAVICVIQKPPLTLTPLRGCGWRFIDFSKLAGAGIKPAPFLPVPVPQGWRGQVLQEKSGRAFTQTGGGCLTQPIRVICDYSISQVASRPAVVGEKLVTTNFGTGSRGFAGVDDPKTAVCCIPGTELAFDEGIKGFCVENGPVEQKVAIFRQINRDNPHQHHDCLELPDGRQLLLTFIAEGQKATVLQLPAAPKTEAEAKEQTRLEVVG